MDPYNPCLLTVTWNPVSSPFVTPTSPLNKDAANLNTFHEPRTSSGCFDKLPPSLPYVKASSLYSMTIQLCYVQASLTRPSLVWLASMTTSFGADFNV